MTSAHLFSMFKNATANTSKSGIVHITSMDTADGTTCVAIVKKTKLHPRCFYLAEQEFVSEFVLIEPALDRLKLTTQDGDQADELGQGVYIVGSSSADKFLQDSDVFITQDKVAIYADLSLTDDIGFASSIDIFKHPNNPNHQLIGFAVGISGAGYANIVCDIMQVKSYLLEQYYSVEYHEIATDVFQAETFIPSNDILLEKDSYINGLYDGIEKINHFFNIGN